MWIVATAAAAVTAAFRCICTTKLLCKSAVPTAILLVPKRRLCCNSIRCCCSIPLRRSRFLALLYVLMGRRVSCLLQPLEPLHRQEPWVKDAVSVFHHATFNDIAIHVLVQHSVICIAFGVNSYGFPLEQSPCYLVCKAAEHPEIN